MQYWFISDTHFSHANIIQYCNRPFNTVEEMNETIIENWNKVVGINDMVFHLGDFCFKTNPICRLNGKIILIRGNHDSRKIMKTIVESIVILYDSHNIKLVHSPTDVDTSMVNFVGHVHDKWKIKYHWKDRNKLYPVVNIGVDVWDFTPVSLHQIFKRVEEYRKKGDGNAGYTY